MGFLAKFIRGLWYVARTSWVSISPDLRPRSGASALMLFFFFIFFIVGLILMALGVDLDTADRWIEAQGGWLDALGTALFRLLCGLILLCCVGVVLGGLWQMLFQRGQAAVDEDERVGCLTVGIAAVIAYFAWFGVFS